MLPKAFCNSAQSQSAFQWHVSQTGKPEIWMEPENTLGSRSDLDKKSNAGNIVLRNFKFFYKSAQIQAAWHWSKIWHIDQGNSTDCPEINPGTYGPLIYDTGFKGTQWGKPYLPQMVLGTLSRCLLPYIKIHLRLINLNVKTQVIQHLARKKCRQWALWC